MLVFGIRTNTLYRLDGGDTSFVSSFEQVDTLHYTRWYIAYRYSLTSNNTHVVDSYFLSFYRGYLMKECTASIEGHRFRLQYEETNDKV